MWQLNYVHSQNYMPQLSGKYYLESSEPFQKSNLQSRLLNVCLYFSSRSLLVVETPYTEGHFRDCHQDFFFLQPSCKKHRPQIRSCCLRVGQRLLQSQCFCPEYDDLCPGRWTSGKRSWLVVVEGGPGWLQCCYHMPGCECCTDAEGRQRFHHQAGTETGSGSVLLWRGISISQMVAL